jgi:alpha-1,6-mannosyltransferase
MKIVQIANFVSPTSGGLRTTLRHLAAGYTQRGHEVVQVFPAKSDGHSATEEASQVLLRSPLLGSTGYRIHLDVRRVRRVLERLAPDVVEVHDRTTLRGAGAWARANGIPAAAVSHERMDRWLNQWLPAHLPLEMIADRSNAGLARAFDTIVCTTGWAAEEFRRLGITNLSTIPLGVDHDQFTARLEGRRDASVLLVMASRLSREKRPEIAVEAVRELVRRRVDVRLIVAGDGPMRHQLEKRGAGLPILWLGFVAGRAELAGLLRAADLALAPGPVETFGLAALEALACGTPAIVNWRSALPEIVGPAAGRAVAGSGFTFADAVQDLLAEPEIPLRCAARARAEEFGWNATVEGFLALHQRARGPVAA